jgi:hypothetical protein
MCRDGFLFCNDPEADIQLSQESTNFESLNPFDDKCIAFSAYASQDITVFLKNERLDNESSQFFWHESYFNYSSISSNTTKNITSSEGEPALLRIVSGSVPPDHIRIHMHSEADQPRVAYKGYWKDNLPDQLCPEVEHWWNKNTAIGLICTVAVIGAVTVSFFLHMCVGLNVSGRAIAGSGMHDTAQSQSGLSMLYMSLHGD